MTPPNLPWATTPTVHSFAAYAAQSGAVQG